MYAFQLYTFNIHSITISDSQQILTHQGKQLNIFNTCAKKKGQSLTAWEWIRPLKFIGKIRSNA